MKKIKTAKYTESQSDIDAGQLKSQIWHLGNEVGSYASLTMQLASGIRNELIPLLENNPNAKNAAQKYADMADGYGKSLIQIQKKLEEKAGFNKNDAIS